MIVHRRGPRVWVFAVDDHRIQLTWRQLRPGTLRISTDAGTDPVEVEVGADRRPGSLTLDGLPAGRLLQLDLDGSALDGPRRLAARTLAALPGEELCRVATLSDLHVGALTFGHRGGIRDPHDHLVPHPRRCATAALAEIDAWGAERVVVKGDLTNGARSWEWREYASIAHASPVPVDAIPGNHDNAPYRHPLAVPPHDAARAFDVTLAEPLLVRDLPGLRMVLVDCTVPARHGGTLAPVRDDLVDLVAEAPTDGGVLVVLHQHLQPHVVSEGWPVGIGHRESVALLDDLGRAHPHVVVTSGHSHRNRRWGRAGVVVTQVGSTKDYPGVWAGYQVFEGGLRQTVWRVSDPDCLAWTDHSRTAAFGLWEHASPGRLDARCFNVAWSRPA